MAVATAAQKNETGMMMDEPVARALSSFSRFGTPDLSDKGIWMTKRIRAQFPHLQDRYILSWLGTKMPDNSCLFVHTKNAVVMAEKIVEDLNQQPSVKVWFVLARDKDNKDHIEEAADLYEAVSSWAADIGAFRIIDIDKFTDVPKPIIQTRLGGRLLIEEIMFARPTKK